MISVIIPVYNGERTIGKCLESVTNQTKEPGEIIVVDDGSTDNTRGIVKEFKEAILLVQEHKGPAVARNFGARKAKGEILLFTDSDCVPERNWTSEMAKPFRNKNIAGVQGIYGTMQRELMARFSQLEIEDRYERMKSFGNIDFIGSYSAGYRKPVFLESGGFDESFPAASGEDPELSFKLAEMGHKMVLNPRAMVYHEHPNTFGKYLKQKFYRAYWRILLYKKHSKKAIKEAYTPQSLKIQIVLFYLLTLSLILSPFNANLFYIPVSLFIILLLSALPFSIRIYSKDRAAGLACPFIVISRTAVFGAGMISGFIRLRRLLFSRHAK